jgi:hypothetical protein
MPVIGTAQEAAEVTLADPHVSGQRSLADTFLYEQPMKLRGERHRGDGLWHTERRIRGGLTRTLRLSIVMTR